MNTFGFIWSIVFFLLILIAHVMGIIHIWGGGKSWEKWIRIVAAIFLSILPIMAFFVAISMIFEKGLDIDAIPTICTVCTLGILIVYEVKGIIHLFGGKKSLNKSQKFFTSIAMLLFAFFVIGMILKLIISYIRY